MGKWVLKHSDGESYDSEILDLELDEARSLKRLGWERKITWSKYLQKGSLSKPYKLLVLGDANKTIQGAIAYKYDEGFVYVELLESAPTNRHNNPSRTFTNVSSILLGEACRKSFEAGFDGFICFKPKSNLDKYYITEFNAAYTGMGQMAIGTLEARRLIELYYV
ncbi:hypothetical protein [Paenibacillus sp. GCM10012306]|uniref:hypothetical protein n=1 Tax=Paenibacillus sp. GCM10012306 TaxID=3317342 RepID=UPI003615D734